jgi:hypothetical protein
MRPHRVASFLSIFIVEHSEACTYCTSEFVMCQGKQIDRNLSGAIRDGTASVVRNFFQHAQVFLEQTSSAAQNVAIVCAALI